MSKDSEFKIFSKDPKTLRAVYKTVASIEDILSIKAIRLSLNFSKNKNAVAFRL
jgi:hypothetical protein